MALDYRILPGAALAYVGDAAFEVLVRRRLIEEGQTQSGKMSRLALSYVKATAQSEAADRILPLLTEEESDIFRRGRNAHGISAPKSAGTGEYRRFGGSFRFSVFKRAGCPGERAVSCGISQG